MEGMKHHVLEILVLPDSSFNCIFAIIPKLSIAVFNRKIARAYLWDFNYIVMIGAIN